VRLRLVTSALLLAALPAAAATAASGHAPAGHRPAAAAHTGIRHVFVVVLENEDYEASYGATAHPYLGRVLPAKGALLTEYHAIAHVSQPNYIAMVSGQGPNPVTQSDCQQYVDFLPSPAVFDPRGNGQALGAGCVYPAQVRTLPEQLTDAGLTWRGYMEDMGATPSREPARCGQPGDPAPPGTRDQTQAATAGDQYAARHNPFVYFHSLLDSGACARNVVPLTALEHDLARVSTTRNLSFITPNLCNDGHDEPCVGKDAMGSSAGGFTSVDNFLRVWVPRILASPAFGKDGLLVITTDEAEVGGDASACCGEPIGPDSPMPGITGPGGGRTGALVIGRCVEPGSRVATPYNHYSLLRSLEDLFHVGHLGYAGADGLRAFGRDVFRACPTTSGRA
jgi:phosphatidylinositol-3-phosphatase